MDARAVLDSAFDLAQRAVTEERLRHAESACALYTAAIERFLEVGRRLDDPRSQLLVRRKVAEFITRVEITRQQMLLEARGRPSPSPLMPSPLADATPHPAPMPTPTPPGGPAGPGADDDSQFQLQLPSTLATGPEDPACFDASLDQLAELKKRFSRLLLGEDMSGGAHSHTSALSISNAITNLAVATFGEVKELAAPRDASVDKWTRELSWLLAPCDEIVVREPATRERDDGTQVEIMVDRMRGDLRTGLPELARLDKEVLAILREAASEPREFSYDRSATREDGKWWIYRPVLDGGELSARERVRLEALRERAAKATLRAQEINTAALADMPMPAAFLDRPHPTSTKSVLGPELHAAMRTKRDALAFSDLVRLAHVEDPWEARALIMRFETAMAIWTKKNRGDKVRTAERVVFAVRSQFPAVDHTDLDVQKLLANKDVGLACLEAYSRVLEGRAAAARGRIEDILDEDDAARGITRPPEFWHWIDRDEIE